MPSREKYHWNVAKMMHVIFISYFFETEHETCPDGFYDGWSASLFSLLYVLLVALGGLCHLYNQSYVVK